MAKYQSTLTGPQMDAALAAMPDAEAYARGTRNGQEVPSTDPTYHNNAKYFAQKAESAFPESYATGAVRGDIDQSTQTEEWRAQARENIGITNPVWGNITGNISSQADLTDVVSPLINQWDEQWESGGIDNNGNNYNINPHIRCKGYIPVKPNTDYYAQISSPYYLKVHFYDINKSHISASLFGRSIFTTPSNAYFIRIWGYSDAYGATYNHDISINYPSTYTGYYPSALPKAKAHIGMLGNVIGKRGWNQLVQNGDFASDSIWFYGGVSSHSVSGNVVTYVASSANPYVAQNINVTLGHKYLITCQAYQSESGAMYISNQFGVGNSNVSYSVGTWETLVACGTSTTSGYKGIVFDPHTKQNGNTLKVRNFMVCDLTAMGLDSINTPEEFRVLFSADYYPYASGSWADLLWENASIGSDFSAQDISVNLSNYSFVAIEFQHYKTQEKGIVSSIRVGESACLFGMSGTNGISGDSINGALQVGARALTTTSTKVHFGNGYVSNSGGTFSQNDGCGIPIRIYGIR